MFCFSSRRRHTRCALVTGVQTCALPILAIGPLETHTHPPQPDALDRSGPYRASPKTLRSRRNQTCNSRLEHLHPIRIEMRRGLPTADHTTILRPARQWVVKYWQSDRGRADLVIVLHAYP